MVYNTIEKDFHDILRGSYMKQFAKSEYIGAIVLSILFSLIITFQKTGQMTLARLAASFCLYTLLLLFIIFVVLSVFKKFKLSIHTPQIEHYLYDTVTTRRFFFLTWGINLLFWIPAYLAFFPGIFGYDSAVQLLQFTKEEPLSSHHPVLHTMILGAFVDGGYKLFNNYNVGIAVMCLIELIIVTLILAKSFVLLRRIRIAFPLLLLSYIWILLNPVLQVLCINTTKDILFGAAFLNFNLCLYLCLTDKTVKDYISLIISGILVCLLRNQGIYIVAVLLLFAVMLAKENKRLLLSVFIVLIISKSFFIVTEKFYNVSKGDSREMLSVPIQQMSLVSKLYLDGFDVNFPKEDFELFCNLVPEDKIQGFEAPSADPVKSYFNTEEFKSNVSTYLKLYFKTALHNPGYFLTAWADLSREYFDPSTIGPRKLALETSFPQVSSKWDIQRYSLLPGYEAYLSEFITQGMEKKLPVLSFLIYPNFCIWLFVSLFGIGIMRKNKKAVLLSVTPILFLGTIMLGPVALLRYLYPIALMTPLLLGFISETIQAKNQ